MVANGTIFWKNATRMYHFLEKWYIMVHDTIFWENGSNASAAGRQAAVIQGSPGFALGLHIVSHGAPWGPHGTP